MKQSTLHKKLSKAALLGCLTQLLVVFVTGCGQNPVMAKTNATPTPRAAGAPTSVPATPTSAPAAAAISPERLAAARTLIVSLGCVGCHTIDTIPEAIGIIAPNLTHVATRAESTIASAEYKATGKATTVREYLQESVLSPSTYLSLVCPTGPCPDFVMPRDFKTRIAPADLEIILDLLSSLK